MDANKAVLLAKIRCLGPIIPITRITPITPITGPIPITPITRITPITPITGPIPITPITRITPITPITGPITPITAVTIHRDRSGTDIQRVLAVRSLANYFLEHCLSAVPWRDYAVVGFTSTFEQNIASLAMARHVKHLSPATAIVFGGANWEGEMGHELHRRFLFVDYVARVSPKRVFPSSCSGSFMARR